MHSKLIKVYKEKLKSLKAEKLNKSIKNTRKSFLLKKYPWSHEMPPIVLTI